MLYHYRLLLLVTRAPNSEASLLLTPRSALLSPLNLPLTVLSPLNLPLTVSLTLLASGWPTKRERERVRGGTERRDGRGGGTHLWSAEEAGNILLSHLDRESIETHFFSMLIKF